MILWPGTFTTGTLLNECRNAGNVNNANNADNANNANNEKTAGVLGKKLIFNSFNCHS